ncbi:hypothetical protein Forpe1208_v014701 [Fusarium oxysporum f. sp. rapae]|uniref:Uncharacterized protein n=1 Tax=Fusarium oxysporum f. sp. rapae TaxID=485398 RepID=A0A8J5NIJ9_FUSOX|nr:hypothetical protein Forpe1208_v014701 [Fusarium oxysporum f. sp. rapae]
MTWDRYKLGQKNIFYDEKRPLIPVNVFPPHVERVRRLITDLSCVVKGEGLVNNNELISDDKLKPLLYGPDPDPALVAAQKTLSKAHSLVNGGYKEPKWQAFYEADFFERLTGSLSSSKDDTRRVSYNKYYYDAVTRETDVLWDLFKKDKKAGIGPFESLSCPKPDQAFFLPIYHNRHPAGIPTVVDPNARQWNRAQEISAMEPFTWSTLQKLHKFGLQPSPCRLFEKPPLEADLKCYPWLVVEHKKEKQDDTPVRVVCCQAANAAACAISLIRHTAQYAVKLPKHAHIPPIPVITTIGPSVTVWIMYYATDFDAPCSHRNTTEETVKRRKEGCIMRVIWNGEMTKLADVVMFQMILDNAHTWATRAFKPLMSSYIEQWQHVFDESTVSLTSGHNPFSLSKKRREKTVEQRRAILPIVQSLLDDQATMELDDMANKKVTPLFLGLLMHQICSSEKEFITSEVDRVVSQKLEGLSMKGLTAGKQYSSRGGENARSQAHSDCYSDYQESIFGSRQTSQYLLLDNDDPNDSDYRPSQDSSAPAQTTSFLALGPPRSNTQDVFPSDYKFSFHSLARGISKRPEVQPSASKADRLFNSPDGDGRETPSISGGQVTPEPIRSPLLSILMSGGSGSLAGNVSRDISKGTTPSGSPVFTGRSPPERRGWSPGRQSGQPNPPQPPSPLEGSSEKRQFQDAGQDESDYIDLTRDSQESAS